MSEMETDNSLDLLRQAVEDIRYAVDRIREWPTPPDASLVAGWAPLLTERLQRIEECLVHCQDRLRPPQSQSAEKTGDRIQPGTPMSAVERIHILQTLTLAGGNREHAARLLNIGARTLYRKLKSYGLS